MVTLARTDMPRCPDNCEIIDREDHLRITCPYWSQSGRKYRQARILGHGVSSAGHSVIIIQANKHAVRLVYPSGAEGVVTKKGMQSLTFYYNQSEESEMSKYGNQSHDQIFEALVDSQYYTVGVTFDEANRLYAYRVPAHIELSKGDQVVVSTDTQNPEQMGLAKVHKVHKNKEPRATAWVIQKVDTSANTERQENWTTLYEGIKKAELAKKKAIIAEGYGDVLAQYDPTAAAILEKLSKPALTSDS